MEYVQLGRTGLKVSRLCLGTMTYGSKRWREWVLEEPESRPFIRRALELGINFFDTADIYSLGVSEEILGRALKEFGPSRDKVVIATKVFQAMGDDRAGIGRRSAIDGVEAVLDIADEGVSERGRGFRNSGRRHLAGAHLANRLLQ